jgi:hypothetical protein
MKVRKELQMKNLAFELFCAALAVALIFGGFLYAVK